MATFEYSVDGQSITTTKAGRLVSGTIGVNTVKFTFDSSWDGLEKWATFDPNPGKPYKQPLDANGECLIPGEVMGGISLRIGVFGLAEGQAYPTVWANKLPMDEGCYVDVPPSDWPEPSPLLEDVVKVSAQTFTDEQKAQARTNIGAAGSAEMTTALAGKVNKPVGATEGNVAIIGSNNNIIDSGKSFADIYDSAMIHKTASGSIATIEDGADDAPIKTMTAQIVPIQAGSGVPSPTNVRAITGWTEAKVTRNNGNVVEISSANLIIYRDNYDHISVDSQGVVTITGQTLAAFPFKAKSGATYTITVDTPNSTNQMSLRVYGSATDTITWSNAEYIIPVQAITAPKSKATFTVPSGIRTVFVAFYATSSVGTYTINHIQCEVGSVSSDWLPLCANTDYTIEFPTEAGTVYGGELVVNEDGTGTLTVNKGKKALSAIPKSVYSTYAAGGRLITNYFDYMTNVVAVDEKGILSNVMPVKRGTWPTTGSCIFVGSGSGRTSFLVDQNDIGAGVTINANNVNSWYDEIGAYAVYDLATPVTYQLTAPQVSTLLGLNNIWGDTGDISVTYRADPTLATEEQAKAIKESIAYVQNDFTAVQQYLVNDLVYVGDTLYIVTSAIAHGATMTPNTNITATTLNAVIKSLR